MITTGSIKVNLSEGQAKLKRVTTRNVDASIKVEHPTQKPVALSTRNLPDVADIVEKKRRDDIMAERKLAEKDEKKVVMVEKVIVHPVTKDIKVGKTTTGEYEVELEKKPWNKMNAKERKEHQAEKARKNKEKDDSENKKD